MNAQPIATPAPTPAARSGAFAFMHRVFNDRRSLSLVDQAVVSLMNMGTSIIIGRTCLKEELGLYASGLSLILLVTAIQSALITVPYTIANPRIPAAEHPLYKGGIILQQVTLALIAMLVFLGIAVVGSTHRSADLRHLFFTLAAVSGIICFRDFVRRLSYAELKFGFALTTDLIVAVLQILLIGGLAWHHQLSASRALLVVGITSICAGLLWLAVNLKEVRFSIAHAISGFRINWSLGRWLFASSVLWSFCIDQYPWLIAALRQPSEAAIWASCYGVMAFLNPIVLALNNDAAPRVSHDYAAHGLAGLSRSVVRSSLIAAVITLPVLLTLFFFGARLVRLMYGARYGMATTSGAGIGTIVSLLAVGLWFYAISLAFPYGMLTLKRPGIDFAVNVACIVCFLAVGLWLVRTHGVVGAACSFLMVQAVALMLRVFGFWRVLQQAQTTPSGQPAGVLA